MAGNTLDERDRAILERLHRGETDVESLAGTVNTSPEDVREHLPRLLDNGLVERVGDDTYALTEDGERVVAASPAGLQDNRIDTPEDVEAAIESYDLRPDREEAVRNAFAFLHYWGEATAPEIVDAIFPEDPAEYDDSDAWWTELVRDRLAALPSVDPPDSPNGAWRYDGTPTVDQRTDDSRLLLGPKGNRRNSVKFALERLPVEDDERQAVRAAFELLAESDDATATAFREQVYPDRDAGYESADDWWAFVREHLAELPGVEREGDGNEAVWRYWRTTPDE
ncbi:winged helix-turn-helix domain-containing protein [Halobacterium wangiae]|uniref:winged helix-turn-helix domain-containing protein n=1 Tax=Halobacterium wangiae TaxID=2902623 RepID=UPI001E2B065D|nr:winged helix-turn-helix domain-containing protein [Halobacterium wangiae]